MQVVDQSHETGAGLRQLVFSTRAADEGIGFKSRSFEGDPDLVVVHAKVAQRGMDMMGLAQIFDDPQLCDPRGVLCIHPAAIEPPLFTGGGQLVPELVGMVEGQTGCSEKEDDREAEHRQIDVQPSHQHGRPSFHGEVAVIGLSLIHI